MKKYKRKKNKNLIRMFIIIAAALITLTIGYSLFTDTLFINGTANKNMFLQNTNIQLFIIQMVVQEQWETK